MAKPRRKASGIRCARCGMHLHASGYTNSPYEDGRMKQLIRRWLGLSQPHDACWLKTEVLSQSLEIGALKGLLIDSGACTSEQIDASLQRQRDVCGG